MGAARADMLQTENARPVNALANGYVMVNPVELENNRQLIEKLVSSHSGDHAAQNTVAVQNVVLQGHQHMAQHQQDQTFA